ncbi:MAG TPA: hypothetical protein VGN97_21900 [Mesorhizobium sp.]|jgi:predicted membrane chloride channel (bestrophin family)|nr:hypothetical protein [Mesorhizobium sp.]
MNTATREVIASLAPVVAAATARAVTHAPTTMDGADASRVAAKVAAEVAPIIVNQTNNERWWESRVTWGAILAALAGILGLFGWAMPEEMQGRIVDVIVAAGPLVSALIVLYGRWVAKKPLGQ